MPVSSEKQRRFMYGVMSGSIKKKGLSKKEAKEFIDSTPKGKKLPFKVKKKK